MAARRQKKASTWSHDTVLDCTSKCQHLPHANVVLRCAALGNLDLLKHCSTICGNPWNISDVAGRTVLHVTASKGHLNLVEWLLKRKCRYVDVVDVDSHWSALHRAAYYGHPGVMVTLVKAGANINLLDNEGYSPLNILQANLNLIDTYPAISEVCLYIWGMNENMTLGHDHSRSIPELLETSPSLGNINQVVLCKFHTLLLTESGCVYSCGHGPGGRLGHGNEHSVVSPKLIESLRTEKCIEVAAARNHSVFLLESGVVFSCGINDAHQLGVGSKSGSVKVSPTLIKALKTKRIRYIGAGRYHTAICTTTEVYSFGKNLGQLGYVKTLEMQTTPKLITNIVVDDGDSIDHLSVSDGATACITSKRHQIFVCINYIVLRCERYNFPESLSITQFCVCANLGELEHKQNKKKESKESSSGCGLVVALLDSEHQLWFSQWTEYTKKGCIPPQIINGATKCSVSHFCLTKNLTIATVEGEVYTGPVTASPSLLSLTRVPLIQQAKKVFTDYKTTNLAVLQNVYRSSTLPLVETSTLSTDIHNLLSENGFIGTVADVQFNISGSVFIGNSVILSSCSSVFSSLFSSTLSLSSASLIKSFSVINSQWSIDLDLKNSVIFELFLHYVYGGQTIVQPSESSPKPVQLESPPTHTNSKTSLDNTSGEDTSTTTDWNILYDQFGSEKNSFDLLSQQVTEGETMTPENTSPNTKYKGNVEIRVHITTTWTQDLEMLHLLGTTFKVKHLVKNVESILSRKGKPSPVTLTFGFPILKRNSVPHDVVLVTEEGKEICCHKCVLVARSDYFQSMLLRGWRESTSEEKVTRLHLPIPFELMEIIVNYLYTDTATPLLDSNSTDLLTSALVVADQFLLSRLKTICEQSLAKCLNIRNIAEMLEFSSTYNAEQLQESCLQFISLNLPVLLEGGLLEPLTSSSLDLLSHTYQTMFSAIGGRSIDSQEPSTDELPQSYLHNEIIDISDIEDNNNDDARTTYVTTPTRAKSPLVDTPTGSSRKKKKRRSSTSREDKKSHVTSSHMTDTPPMSPEPVIEEHPLNIEEPLSLESLNEEKQEKTNGIHVDISPWCIKGQSSDNSLRQIMAEQQEKENKKKEKKKPVKPVRQMNDVSKQLEKTWSDTSPTDPLNPWGLNTTSPTTHVSLRELMAEAEAEEKISPSLPVQRSLSYECPTAVTASDMKIKSSSQIMSFVDIVNYQQKEMDKITRQKSLKKSLQLIQIEEEAIQQLLQLYNADNNPDEFITIERIPQDTKTTTPTKWKATPTSTSVWDSGKAKFN